MYIAHFLFFKLIQEYNGFESNTGNRLRIYLLYYHMNTSEQNICCRLVKL